MIGEMMLLSQELSDMKPCKKCGGEVVARCVKEHIKYEAQCGKCGKKTRVTEHSELNVLRAWNLNNEFQLGNGNSVNQMVCVMCSEW